MACTDCINEINTTVIVPHSDCNLFAIKSDLITELNDGTITELTLKYSYQGESTTEIALTNLDITVDVNTCTTCPDDVFYQIQASETGIYSIQLEAQKTCGRVIEHGCFFYDCGLQCLVYKAIVLNPSTDLHIIYESLKSASYCADDSCSTWSQVYEYFITKLQQTISCN